MRILSLLLVSSFGFACGDDDTSDSGLLDTGAADVSVSDTGLSMDAVTDPPDVTRVDAGPSEVDAGPSEVDAGPSEVDAGPVGPCDGLDIGGECPCAEPYFCRGGVCVPGRERESCGGVVGAMCTTRTFPECTYRAGADFGPCLSTQERLCVCAEHRDQYSCRGM